MGVVSRRIGEGRIEQIAGASKSGGAVSDIGRARALVAQLPFYRAVLAVDSLHRHSLADGLAEHGANLPLRPADPAVVEARVFDLNGKIVASVVAPGCRAGWTPCLPVPVALACRLVVCT